MRSVEDLGRYMSTPLDWNAIEENRRAGILVLSLIGYLARPKDIPEGVLKRCIEAFNNNRGRVEKEEEAIQEVLNEIRNNKRI